MFGSVLDVAVEHPMYPEFGVLEIGNWCEPEGSFLKFEKMKKIFDFFFFFYFFFFQKISKNTAFHLSVRSGPAKMAVFPSLPARQKCDRNNGQLKSRKSHFFYGMTTISWKMAL